MSLIHIKIIYTYYTRKRTTPLFIPEDELMSDDFQSFKDRIITEVPHLAKTCSPLQLTILDGELEVDLSPDYFALQMKELLNKGKEITLQAFTFESPGAGVVADTHEKVQRSLPRPEVRRALQIPLHDLRNSDCEDDIFEDKDTEGIYLSRVDKLIESKQQEIKTQKEKIAEKTKEIENLEETFSVKPLHATRPACSKCHLRAGHTRPNCQNKVCMSARLCGDLKRHPEEKKEMKDLQSELKLLHTTLKRQNDELSNLQATVKSSKRTFSQLIHSNLINSNKHKYISQSMNGGEVINWMLLNTDSKKIEKMWGGKVPGPDQNLQEIITQHDSREEQTDINLKANKTNKQVKELWAKKGVVFPGSGPMSRGEPDTKSSPATSIPIPLTTEEEAYQTNLAIRESKREAASTSSSLARQDRFPMSVNSPPVMHRFPSNSYPQFDHTGYGNSGTPVAFPYFYNPHFHPSATVPARYNVPTEPQIYHNYNPNLPSVQTFSTEVFSPESAVSAPYHAEHTAHETDAKTSTEVNQNPFDILANVINSGM